MNWRTKIAEVAGLPPLELMAGFYRGFYDNHLPTLYHGPGTGRREFSPPYLSHIDERLPIMWECLKPSALHELLFHSDCDGEIAAERCGPIADALEPLINLLPNDDAGGHIGNWKEKTQKFVDGLRAAAKANEDLRFR